MRALIIAFVLTAVSLQAGWFWEKEQKFSELLSCRSNLELKDDRQILELSGEVISGGDQKELKVLKASASLLSAELPEGIKVIFRDGAYFLQCRKEAQGNYKLNLFIRAQKKDSRGSIEFFLPPLVQRPLTISLPDASRSLHVLGALEKMTSDKKDRLVRHYFVGSEDRVSVSWKESLRQEKAEEAALLCFSYAVNKVTTGSAEQTHLLQYRVARGSVKELKIAIDKSLNVTALQTDHEFSWQLEKKDEGHLLRVTFPEALQGDIELLIKGEKNLPPLPAQYRPSWIEPLDVLRHSGFMAIGCDPQQRMHILTNKGLTRVGENAFIADKRLQLPRQNLAVFSMNNSKAVPDLSIKAAEARIHTESQISLNYKAAEVTAEAIVQIKVHEAPLSELVVELDKNSQLRDVRIAGMESYETQEGEKHRNVRILFSRPLAGQASLQLKWEMGHKGGELTLPKFKIRDSRISRGVIKVFNERGFDLNLKENRGLTQLQPAGTRRRNSALTLRYDNPQWQATVVLKQRPASLFCEAQQLYTIGEQMINGSLILTCHLSGSPQSSIKIQVPTYVESLKVSGMYKPQLTEIDKSQGLYTVLFDKAVEGDVTLLLGFEQKMPKSGENFTIGGIRFPDARLEQGYIAISGGEGVILQQEKADGALFSISEDELPSGTRFSGGGEILKSYRFNTAPHELTFSLKNLAATDLVTAAFQKLNVQTVCNEKGECESKVDGILINARNAFLPLSLPAGASLWTVKVNGRKTLCTQTENGLQIPLPRPHDSRRPVKIHIHYAHPTKALKSGEDFAVESFSSPISGLSGSWKVRLPSGLHLKDLSTNLEKTQITYHRSRLSFLQQSQDILKNIFRYPLAWVSFLLAPILLIGAHFIQSKKIFWRSLAYIFLAVTMTVIFLSPVFKTRRVEQPAPQTQVQLQARLLPVSKPWRLAGKLEKIQAEQSTQESLNLYFAAAALLLLSGSFWKKTPYLFGLSLLSAYFAAAPNENAFFVYNCLLLASLYWCLSRLPLKILARRLTVLCLFLCSVSNLSAKDLVPKEVVPVAVAVPVEPKHLQADASVYSINVLNRNAQTARCYLQTTIEAKGAHEQIQILPNGVVLEKAEFNQELLSLSKKDGYFILSSLKEGSSKVSVTFIAPIKKDKTTSAVIFEPLRALSVKAELKLPEQGYQVLDKGAANLSQKGVAVEAWYPPGEKVNLSWKPQWSGDRRQELLFVARSDAEFTFSNSGARIRHNIAVDVTRGELAVLDIVMPSGQTVTSVASKDLYNWTLDPENSLLKLHYRKKKSTSFNVRIDCHSGSDSGRFHIEALHVSKVSRQTGTVVLNESSEREISVEESRNFLRLQKQTGNRVSHWRFSSLPASLDIITRPVLPEITSTSQTQLNLLNDSFLMQGRLSVQISRAGIFSTKLILPKDWNLESLEGQGISHWLRPDKKGPVEVFFSDAVKGQVVMAFALSRPAFFSREMTVSGIYVDGEKRHRGSLEIMSARGLRTELIDRRSLGQNGSGIGKKYSVFQNDWYVKLKLEKMQPLVEAESLQKVRLSNGEIRVTQTFDISVERSGIDRLTLKFPAGSTVPEISGRDVSSVKVLSDGLRRVLLKRRIFERCHLQLSYRQKAQDELQISPVILQEARLQKTALAIYYASHLQAQFNTIKGRLMATDPVHLAGLKKDHSLTAAAASFRSQSRDFTLSVLLKRHALSEQLKIDIHKVSIKTVLSQDGASLNLMELKIRPPYKSVLEMSAPQGTRLYAAIAGDEQLPCFNRDNLWQIPLTKLQENCDLQILYACETRQEDNKTRLSIPKFEVPLRNISWTVCTPGDLDWEIADSSLKKLNESYYRRDDNAFNTQQPRAKLRTKVNDLIDLGFRNSNAGNIGEATQNLRQAIQLSGAYDDLYEDARGQMEKVLQDQFLESYISSRDNLQNRFQKKEPSGKAKALRQNIDDSELLALDSISRSLLRRHGLTSLAVSAVNLKVPLQGRIWNLEQELQMSRQGSVFVDFSSKPEKIQSSTVPVDRIIVMIICLLISLLSFLGLGRRSSVSE